MQEDLSGIRPSPSAHRATRLLNYLAARRAESFTVSELARALKLNRATCQAVLMALEDAGFVRRDQRTKAYGLGPALIPLGEAALSSLEVVEEARPEIDRLASVTGLEAVASVALDATVLIVVVAGAPRRGGTLRVGQAVPLRAPFGTAFVAWAGDDAIKTWLDRATSLTAELRRHYVSSLAAVRERGYSITLEIGSPERLAMAMAEMASQAGDLDDLALNQLLYEEYVLPERDEPGPHRIEQITVPVFDAGGGVPLVIGLTGFAHDLTLEQLARFVTPLLVASRRLTARLGGRRPVERPDPAGQQGRQQARQQGRQQARQQARRKGTP
jgi:DNA-binding IclR family transcriptional regulator